MICRRKDLWDDSDVWFEFFIQVDHSREYALITEFSVIKSLISPTVMKPEDPDDNETPIPNLSWLNIAHCKCNCCFPKKGHVLVNKDDGNIYSSTLASCSGNANDSIVDDSSQEDMVLYMPKDFNCKGAHFMTSFSLPSKSVNRNGLLGGNRLQVTGPTRQYQGRERD